MAGEFGAFIARKRIEKDVKLKQISEATGMSVTYLSDIIKGRRNPPEDEKILGRIAKVLNLNEEERDEMNNLAGKDRNQAPPDLSGYINSDEVPHARVALRKAKNRGLGDDFWKKVNTIIDEEGKNDE